MGELKAALSVLRYFVAKILRNWTGSLLQLPDNNVSHISDQYLLMLQQATVHILYRNCRKSSEAHCYQWNQKVATQTDIQCAFQLLHKPIKKKKRMRILLKEILLQGTALLPNFVTASFITQLARSNFRQNNFLKFWSCVLEWRLVKTFVIVTKNISNLTYKRYA